jgi:hypothetical protein
MKILSKGTHRRIEKVLILRKIKSERKGRKRKRGGDYTYCIFYSETGRKLYDPECFQAKPACPSGKGFVENVEKIYYYSRHDDT